jgi:hypothetical protein
MTTHAHTTAKADRLLLRYREKDTKNGVTKHTALQAAEALGISETQLVHLALAQFVARELPQYERDDGPLSKEALAAIARRVPQDGHGPVLSSLLD